MWQVRRSLIDRMWQVGRTLVAALFFLFILNGECISVIEADTS